MSYKVKILPANAPAGWLAKGGKSSMPTYYPHPGPARTAAENYVARHPGDICEVMTWKNEAIVEVVQ